MSKTLTVDTAVLKILPEGTQILSTARHGTSAWTTTTCISATLETGVTRRYFLKCATGNSGRIMLLGEFTATTEILKVMPGLVPQVHGWGRLEQALEETWFLLCDFRDMDTTLPDPAEFTKVLADLHRKGTSENGMFGFSVTTCDGALPHCVAWQENWGTFYANLMQGVLDLDTKANGCWEELEAVVEKTKKYVIPRLLGTLQSDGRTLRPSLIHGDMYEGNIGIDRETGKIMIFDASSYYAHNEMELGLWRWIDVMKTFTQSYLENFEASEPVEEWDDRNRLYSIKSKINFSADHTGEESAAMRRVAYDDLCYLCNKYAPSEDS